MPRPNPNSHWTHVSQALCLDFPHLDPATITRCDGDTAALIRHLANGHDLTVREAHDTLDDWLAYTAKRPLTASKAA